MTTEQRRSPKVVKPSPRLIHRAERRDAIAVERVRRYVESVGGEDAFRRKMEALAASHGSTYGLPKIHRGKTFKPETYFEQEVPMRQIIAYSQAHKTAKGLLLPPGGLARATVPIPKSFRNAFTLSAHSTSTFARCGINIVHTQTGLRQQLTRRTLPQTMQVMIHNWSATPVLIREGDPVRLINTAELMGSTAHATALSTAPATRAVGKLMKLHASDQVVRVNTSALNTVRVAGCEVAYVDPHNPQFKTEKFKQLHLQPGDFVVIATRENYSVPAGHVAFVHSAADDLNHTSARLVHSGSSGILALEFQALRKRTIKPGDHVAFLTAHRINSDKPAYRGRYAEQKTPAPKVKR